MNKFLKKITATFAVAAFVGGGLFLLNTNNANARSVGPDVVGCAGAGACVIGGQVKDFAVKVVKADGMQQHN